VTTATDTVSITTADFSVLHAVLHWIAANGRQRTKGIGATAISGR